MRGRGWGGLTGAKGNDYLVIERTESLGRAGPAEAKQRTILLKVWESPIAQARRRAWPEPSALWQAAGAGITLGAG